MEPNSPPNSGDAGRQRAYSAAAKIARARMAEEAPLDAEALARVTAADIIVVRGHYDHVELVLEALEMPFTPVEPAQLPAIRLRPEQLLVVNCPGTVPGASIRQIAAFVEAGGSLFTTDWALRHVIEPAFPGVLVYSNRPTADDVVRIVVRPNDNPFLNGVTDGRDDPQWWLEGSSYPITILDLARVDVLIESSELGAKYGETPVAVLFRHGQGEVFHMISHYYLQRAELRSERQQATGASSASYLASKAPAGPPPPGAYMLEEVAVGEAEAAYSSARLFANIAASARKRAQKRK